ncbi:MAG: fur [Gammaproteobacteria bacterium]|nr:fur [Gammaproteobacteria bacterium]MCE3237920.1 fur [Gammaproteobacteria bacterium]
MNNADLTKAGLKITLPRIKILQLLENAPDRHLSAEEIYRILTESGEDIGLATVYRVLTQFEEAHLVIRHNFTEGHSVFELDLGAHHDHLICVKCNHVEEFIDNEIERRQQEVAEKAGYSITYHHLNIYGVCGNCQIN